MRPVVTSQLLSSWIVQSDRATFTAVQAIEGVRDGLVSLPPGAFVDPELQRRPDGMTRAALRGLQRLGILDEKSSAFHVTAKRRHPQFPLVDDMLAFQARFFRETLEALKQFEGANTFAPLH